MQKPLILPSKRHSLAIFFVLTFAISWPLWILSALSLQGQLPFSFPATLGGLLGAWAPGLVGIFVTLWLDGRRATRLLLSRLLVWRVGLGWYLFALLWPALLSLLSSGISTLLGAAPPDFSNPPVVSQYPLPPEAMQAGFLALLPMIFIIQFFGSSLGEEIGWRGFALPRLQSHRTAFLSSLILGLIWGLWHLPRQWVPGAAFDLAGFAWFLIGITLTSVLYTWIFNNTRGSLLVVVLFHTAQAVSNLFLASSAFPWVSPALTLLLVLWIAYRYDPLHLTRLPTAVSRDTLTE
jgi:membrane protease YdiL (CAAX protease family)